MLVFFAIFCGNSASVAAARAGKSVVQFLWLRRAAPGILGLFAENQWKCLSLNNLRASPRFRRQNPVKPSQTQSNHFFGLTRNKHGPIVSQPTTRYENHRRRPLGSPLGNVFLPRRRRRSRAAAAAFHGLELVVHAGGSGGRAESGLG